MPYLKAIGTGISNASDNFNQQFTHFTYDPVGTTANAVAQFCDAVVTSMDSNGKMFLDEKYKEERLKQLTAQIQKFANLPGQQKLEKLTEFTLGLFSGYAFLGPLGMSGISAAELAALTEASKTMYGALKLECINARDLALQKGLAPSSLAGLTQVIREFPETLVAGLQFGRGEAQKLFKFALNDQELITSNYLGNSIAERIKTFAQRFTKKRNGQQTKFLETGARRVAPKDDFFAWETWAPEQYDKIRKSTSDVDAIVKNTGMTKHKIERIKNHVFYDDTHKLRNSVGRFDPDPEMASAWDRLVTGDFVENDIKLLEHEYFESKFEKLYETDYVTADMATRKTKDRGWKDRDWQADDTKY